MKWALVGVIFSAWMIQAIPLHTTETGRKGGAALGKDAPKVPAECLICQEAVKALFPMLRANKTAEEITETGVGICVKFGLTTEPVCRGLIEDAVPLFYYIYLHAPVEEGNVCGQLLSSYGCHLVNPAALEWTVVPSNVTKPPIADPVNASDEEPRLQVLHLTDLHWDPEYAVGSWAVCQEPLCCRNASTPKLENQTELDTAGYWGAYGKCDTPKQTLLNALEHIASTHKNIDYIMLTGDLIPHDVWETGREKHIAIIDGIVKSLHSYFPNIPVYPTLGNHEGHPTNTFPMPEVDPQYSPSWLYDEADRKWSTWLPAETHKTIRYGGYYTALVKPGLRIISMNNNYCYVWNWWLFYQSNDPASGLAWMTRVLEQAERDGEKVHVIAHIPPGSGDCWTIFAREYTKIVNRFENTVTAQFYGHTHKDQFEIFYDQEDPTRATNIAYIAPSLTTYRSFNPGYRLYRIQGEFPNSAYSVIDHSTWIMNLTKSNLNPEQPPVWYELYRAKSAYHMSGVTPQDWSDLVDRMHVDEDLFLTFYRYHLKDGDPAIKKGCDANCKNKLLCSLVTTDHGHRTHCIDQLK